MSTFELYSMADAFTGSLEFRWGPHEDEPTIIANKIDSMRNALEDMELPLLVARQIAVDDMEQRFNSETDLEGKKWQERSSVYLKEYHEAGYSGTILKRDEHLFDAVTNPQTYLIESNDLLIDTSSWPPYWHAHDSGESVGRNSQLPQRSFAGISEPAQFEIIDAFDDWIDNRLQIIRPGVTGIPMWRGAFGHTGGIAGMGMPRKAPVRWGAPLPISETPFG